MLAHEPTDKLRAKVEAWASVGMSQEQIGKIIGISDDTLRKYYAAELEQGSLKGLYDLAECAHQRALKGSDSLLIFLLKVRNKWREKDDSVPDQVHKFEIVLSNDAVQSKSDTD